MNFQLNGPLDRWRCTWRLANYETNGQQLKFFFSDQTKGFWIAIKFPLPPLGGLGLIFRRNKRRDGAICASQVAEFGESNEIQKLEGISFQSEDIFFMETSGTAHLEHADESAPLTLEPLIGRRKKFEW